MSFCGHFPQSRLLGSCNNHPLLGGSTWRRYTLLFALLRIVSRHSNNNHLAIPSDHMRRMPELSSGVEILCILDPNGYHRRIGKDEVGQLLLQLLLPIVLLVPL